VITDISSRHKGDFIWHVTPATATSAPRKSFDILALYKSDYYYYYYYYQRIIIETTFTRHLTVWLRCHGPKLRQIGLFADQISTTTSVFGDWRISTHADPTSTGRPNLIGVESPTGTFIVLHELADSSDFELLGEQSSQKWEISCLGRRWTAVQSLTPLALSSAEKSVTVQTHKWKNTEYWMNVDSVHRQPIFLGCCIWIESVIHSLKRLLRTTAATSHN